LKKFFRKIFFTAQLFLKRCAEIFSKEILTGFYVINNINIFMLKNIIRFIFNYLNKLLTSYYKLKKQKPWLKKQKKLPRKKALKKALRKQLRKRLLRGSKKKAPLSRRSWRGW